MKVLLPSAEIVTAIQEYVERKYGIHASRQGDIVPFFNPPTRDVGIDHVEIEVAEDLAPLDSPYR
jgi:hypothetical protein